MSKSRNNSSLPSIGHVSHTKKNKFIIFTNYIHIKRQREKEKIKTRKRDSIDEYLDKTDEILNNSLVSIRMQKDFQKTSKRQFKLPLQKIQKKPIINERNFQSQIIKQKIKTEGNEKAKQKIRQIQYHGGYILQKVQSLRQTANRSNKL